MGCNVLEILYWDSIYLEGFKFADFRDILSAIGDAEAVFHGSNNKYVGSHQQLISCNKDTFLFITQGNQYEKWKRNQYEKWN